MDLKQRYGSMVVFCIVGGMTAALLMMGGCGKKAMPAAPGRPLPPVVTDLNGVIEGDRLTLTWTIPAPTGRRIDPVAGVVLHRSTISLAGDDCKNCPLTFERIASLTPPQDSHKGMRYTEDVAAGFRYTYQITLAGENGAMGPASNLFSITH